MTANDISEVSGNPPTDSTQQAPADPMCKVAGVDADVGSNPPADSTQEVPADPMCKTAEAVQGKAEEDTKEPESLNNFVVWMGESKYGFQFQEFVDKDSNIKYEIRPGQEDVKALKIGAADVTTSRKTSQQKRSKRRVKSEWIVWE